MSEIYERMMASLRHNKRSRLLARREELILMIHRPGADVPALTTELQRIEMNLKKLSVDVKEFPYIAIQPAKPRDPQGGLGLLFASRRKRRSLH